MKVMILVKATASSEAEAMPSQALLAAMGRFNDELVREPASCWPPKDSSPARTAGGCDSPVPGAL